MKGTVLILDAHCAAALCFTRSLGRAGFKVMLAAREGDRAVAFKSRYCAGAYGYPDPVSSVAGFNDAVRRLAHELGAQTVIPMTDPTITALYEYDGDDAIAVCASPPAPYRRCSDKYAILESAAHAGLDVPPTMLCTSVEELDKWEGGFPAVVKDRFSYRADGGRLVHGTVDYAFGMEQLSDMVGRRLQSNPDVLVQRFVQGKGYGIAGFFDGERLLAPFQWERIREKDPRGSGSSARRSIPLDRDLAGRCARLLGAMDYRGIAMVELKGDEEGKLWLMEINARPWGSMQLAVHCGVDYPRLLVEHALGGALPATAGKYKTGITCRWLRAELLHLEKVREGPPPGWPGKWPGFLPTLAKIAVPWSPGMRYDHLSLRDPMPGVSELYWWLKDKLA